ncbi:MAG: hypothetical protein KAS58_00050 [Calditrichia bacterium]|nr:hypothetical protein [Calditrichia bacterium]
MTREEKEQIRRVFPNNSVLIIINPNNPPTESSLSSAEWQVITQVDGKKTLQNIIDSLTFEHDQSLEIFYKLHQKKLIEIVGEQKTQKEFAGEFFFKKLEEVLVKIIGPVAVYVINDVLWELNEIREKFLIDKIPLLIESISREILDDKKRVNFQKEMLDLIKGYEIS